MLDGLIIKVKSYQLLIKNQAKPVLRKEIIIIIINLLHINHLIIPVMLLIKLEQEIQIFRLPIHMLEEEVEVSQIDLEVEEEEVVLRNHMLFLKSRMNIIIVLIIAIVFGL